MAAGNGGCVQSTLARVVKLVDTRDLKSLALESGHAGSIPAPGTNKIGVGLAPDPELLS